jgi:hypothetical protein
MPRIQKNRRRKTRKDRKSKRATRQKQFFTRRQKQKGGLYPIDPASKGAVVGYHRLDEKDGYTAEQMGFYDDVVEKIRDDAGI